jgi:hypothetical protein
MRQIVIYGLSGSIIFFHIIAQTARLSKERKKIIERRMCFDLLYFFPRNLSYSNKN